jgi:tripeptide aminopeptidase
MAAKDIAGAEADVAELDLAEADKLVLQLLAIPGPSGQEGAVARFVTEQLREAGAPASAIRFDKAHRQTPLAGDVGNLVLRLPGTVRRPRRMLMAHMDTVPLCVGSKPIVKDGFVRSADPKTGVGADDRAGAAVILAAALAILRHKLPHPPLTFLWTVQEEIGLYGARFVDLPMLGSPKLAFNWDGGNPQRVTIGATGGYRMDIDIRGLASHAGVAPQAGVSAVAIAGLAIAELQKGGWHGEVLRGRQRGTSNVGMIAGGQATNVVTDHVQLKAEARGHNPVFRGRIVRAYEQAFRRAARAVRSAAGQCGKVEIIGRLDYEAFRLVEDDPSVLAAEAALRSTGLEPVRAVSNGGLDANWLSSRGVPTVTLGCGQIAAHTLSEQLDLAAFHSACRVAFRLAAATER